MKIQKMMKRFLVAGAAAVGVASAAGVASTPSAPARAPAAAPVSGVAAHWDRTQGGGIDLRPRLIQGSLFSGTTHTGTRPELLFWARNVSDQSVQAVAERLRDSATFLDAQGQRVAATVKVGPATMPGFMNDVTLAPAEELRADAWYTLSIERDLAIVVGGPEDDAESLQAAKQVRFFTGSAPQIRRIVRSADPRKPTQLDILMSEPVELGSLVREGLRVQVGNQELAGCVAWDSGCVRPDHAGKANAFSFRPASPLREQTPSALVVSVGAGVQGEERTIAAGAAASRLNLDVSTGQARHVVAVAPAAWSRCADAALCWKSPAN